MSDDEQRITAVVALKDIMVSVNGRGSTDSYATNDSSELPAATSWAIPGTGPVSAAAGDAPADEPYEDIVAVVTPKPVTASTRHQPANSLSIAPRLQSPRVPGTACVCDERDREHGYRSFSKHGYFQLPTDRDSANKAGQPPGTHANNGCHPTGCNAYSNSWLQLAT